MSEHIYIKNHVSNSVTPLPYVYMGTHYSDNRKIKGIYVGVRYQNVRLNRTALQDFGVYYRTSSKIVQPIFDEFEWEIIRECDTKEEAILLEREIISEYIHTGWLYNKCAYNDGLMYIASNKRSNNVYNVLGEIIKQIPISYIESEIAVLESQLDRLKAKIGKHQITYNDVERKLSNASIKYDKLQNKYNAYKQIIDQTYGLLNQLNVDLISPNVQVNKLSYNKQNKIIDLLTSLEERIESDKIRNIKKEEVKIKKLKNDIKRTKIELSSRTNYQPKNEKQRKALETRRIKMAAYEQKIKDERSKARQLKKNSTSNNFK